MDERRQSAPSPVRATVAPSTTARRRKVRRGTSSCWECKRRKVRCDLDDGPAARPPSLAAVSIVKVVCTPCRRRGARCVPQHHADPGGGGVDGSESDVQLGARLGRIEALVEGLMRSKQHQQRQQQQQARAVVSAALDVGRDRRFLSTRPPTGQPLSRLVFSFLPSATAVSLIMRRGAYLTLSMGRTKQPYRPLVERAPTQGEVPETCQRRGGRPPAIFGPQADKLPDPGAHPAVLAYKLIQLAICLRHMDPRTELSTLRLAGEEEDADGGGSRSGGIDAGTEAGSGRGLSTADHDDADDVPDVTAYHLRSTSVRGVADHYFSAALLHVTRHDSLVYSLDGIDALILESMYHISSGDCDASWEASRRAVVVARRMGLHRILRRDAGRNDAAASPAARAAHLWFRLVYNERLLSLMLGRQSIAAAAAAGEGGVASNASVDEDAYAADEHLAADLPQARLDKLHAKLLGRIAARNETLRRNLRGGEGGMLSIVSASSSFAPPGSVLQTLDRDCYQETMAIDLELRRAGRTLPPEWWVQPSELEAASSDGATVEQMSRLLSQSHQHFVVVLAHAPYITMPALTAQSNYPDSAAVPAPPSPDYTYSRLTTAHAAAEILSRFLAHTRFKYTPLVSRGIEAKSATAAAALLLSHICAHACCCSYPPSSASSATVATTPYDSSSVLDHRRPGDLDLAGRTIARLEARAKEADDAMTKGCARVLRALQRVESEAAEGGGGGVGKGWLVGGGKGWAGTELKGGVDGLELWRCVEDYRAFGGSRHVRLSVPFFGILDFVQVGADGTGQDEARGRHDPALLNFPGPELVIQQPDRPWDTGFQVHEQFWSDPGLFAQQPGQVNPALVQNLAFRHATSLTLAGQPDPSSEKSLEQAAFQEWAFGEDETASGNYLTNN